MKQSSKSVADAAVQRISTDHYTGQPNLRGLSSEERAAVSEHYNIRTDHYSGQVRVTKK